MYSGYNVNYPYNWLQTAGDATGDVSFQHTQGGLTDGNFFNQTTPAGAPTAGSFGNFPTAGAWYPTQGANAMMAPAGYGTSPEYYNAALARPGSQLPLVTSAPALMNGPQQGPWFYSDYASGTMPSKYVHAMPAWKSAPMQAASAALPHGAQTAAALAATQVGVPMNTQATLQQIMAAHGSASAVSAEAAAISAASGASAGGCAGCGGGGGCGGSGGCSGYNLGRWCRGRNPPVGLDSAHDFLPIHSQPTANAAQIVGAHLYATTSTAKPAWAANHGAHDDFHVPVQGI